MTVEEEIRAAGEVESEEEEAAVEEVDGEDEDDDDDEDEDDEEEGDDEDDARDVLHSSDGLPPVMSVDGDDEDEDDDGDDDEDGDGDDDDDDDEDEDDDDEEEEAEGDEVNLKKTVLNACFNMFKSVKLYGFCFNFGMLNLLVKLKLNDPDQVDFLGIKLEYFFDKFIPFLWIYGQVLLLLSFW